MEIADEGKLDPTVVAALYHAHADQLRQFLVGVVGDVPLALDVVQTTFAKMVDLGHTVEPSSYKAWLFRVAYNEAMAVRRREATGSRVLRQVARWQLDYPETEDPLVRLEAVEAVREALDGLPSKQREIVEMRVYEDKTFAVIANELGIPLGTALARMHAAPKKLRIALRKQINR